MPREVFQVHMQTRFKTKGRIFAIVVTAVGGTLSVVVMLYAVSCFGLANVWPELVLNLCYIACLVLIWMYFFGSSRISTQRFNYWYSLLMGVTVLLHDILFAPPLAGFGLYLALLCMLTFFYARKDWRSYTKRNL